MKLSEFKNCIDAYRKTRIQPQQNIFRSLDLAFFSHLYNRFFNLYNTCNSNNGIDRDLTNDELAELIDICNSSAVNCFSLFSKYVSENDRLFDHLGDIYKKGFKLSRDILNILKLEKLDYWSWIVGRVFPHFESLPKELQTQDHLEKLFTKTKKTFGTDISDSICRVTDFFLSLPKDLQTAESFHKICDHNEFFQGVHNVKSFPWDLLPKSMLNQSAFNQFIECLAANPGSSLREINEKLGMHRFTLQSTLTGEPIVISGIDTNDNNSVFCQFQIEETEIAEDQEYEKLKDLKRLDIVLNDNIDPSRLPYVEEIAAHIKKFNDQGFASVTRANQCIVLARGDSIPPKELFAQGGGGFIPGAVTKGYAPPDQLLDFQSHRVGAAQGTGTGFVSFTKDMKTAEYFSGETGYVYLVKATGAVTPIQNKNDGYYVRECEYSVAGGVDAEDAIAYREKSSIFIRKDYIKESPHTIADVIAFYLRPNEVYKDKASNVSYVSRPACMASTGQSLVNTNAKLAETSVSSESSLGRRL